MPRKGVDCQKCGHHFNDTYKLKLHRERKRPCMSIPDKADLPEENLPEENQDNPHTCKFCGRAFSRSDALTRHMKQSCKIVPHNGDAAETSKLVAHTLRQQVAQIAAMQAEQDALKAQVQALVGAAAVHDKTMVGAAALDTTMVGAAARVEERIAPETPQRDQTRQKGGRKIPAPLRAAVWAAAIGEAIGLAKCVCCEFAQITQNNFHCGHVVSAKAGGEAKLYNLRPICALCNCSMGAQHMDEFKARCGFGKPPAPMGEAEVADFLERAWAMP